MTTSRTALESAVAAVTRADEALQADPSSDHAYRHRENAKVWLAIAGGLANVETTEAMAALVAPEPNGPESVGGGYAVRDAGLALAPAPGSTVAP